MHLLFDLDGTLTNPFLGITNCISYALEKLGRTSPPAESLRWCIGPPLKESFFKLLDTDDPELADEGVAYYRDRFGSVGLFENEIFPEIPECLAILQDKGFTMSVATSKPEVFAKQIIEHFDLSQFFRSVDGAELDGTRTQKPILLSHIIERDRLDPTNTVMIGDRKHDVEGAIANGVYPISVLWGFGSFEELEEAGAKAIVDSPLKLTETILSLDS
ncbi:MAG: HAD family hydrolase [Verrucomicrobiales bacterium]|nr:HAD family hydrolase [Verrucomicrobiales bacterium]